MREAVLEEVGYGYAAASKNPNLILFKFDLSASSLSTSSQLRITSMSNDWVMYCHSDASRSTTTWQTVQCCRLYIFILIDLLATPSNCLAISKKSILLDIISKLYGNMVCWSAFIWRWFKNIDTLIYFIQDEWTRYRINNYPSSISCYNIKFVGAIREKTFSFLITLQWYDKERKIDWLSCVICKWARKTYAQVAMEKLSSEHKAAGHGRHCWSSRHKVGSQ